MTTYVALYRVSASRIDDDGSVEVSYKGEVRDLGEATPTNLPIIKAALEAAIRDSFAKIGYVIYDVHVVLIPEYQKSHFTGLVDKFTETLHDIQSAKFNAKRQ